MPFAYCFEQGARLAIRRGVLRVTRGDEELGALPIGNVEGVVLFGRIEPTVPALDALLRRRAHLAWLTHDGRIKGVLLPPRAPAVHVRLAQVTVWQSAEWRLAFARAIVRDKLAAMEDNLARFAANYPELALGEAQAALAHARTRALAMPTLAALRGVEGSASARYWEALVRCNRSALAFTGRHARPPADPVNAMLGLGYALLLAEVWGMVEATGLDAYVGLYHDVGTQGTALAFDLMEPWRHAIVDRLVLAAVNRGQFDAGDFRPGPNGGTWLTAEGAKRLAALYEKGVRDAEPFVVGAAEDIDDGESPAGEAGAVPGEEGAGSPVGGHEAFESYGEGARRGRAAIRRQVQRLALALRRRARLPFDPLVRGDTREADGADDARGTGDVPDEAPPGADQASG